MMKSPLRGLRAVLTGLAWLAAGVLTIGTLADASEPARTSAETAAGEQPPGGYLICVVGAGGSPEYADGFAQWAANWQAMAERLRWKYQQVGGTRAGDKNQPDRETLRQLLADLPGSQQDNKAAASSPVWLVLLGHGTHDENASKFNLRGPDVSATELAQWLQPCAAPLVCVHCASCSGAFLTPLAGPGRVVITATSSGAEYNYSRFGKYLAAAISNLDADLDHDNQISLLEAYLTASSQTQQFYRNESRLATEHALLDDNGDGKGTPAELYVGIRAGRSKSGVAADGQLAHSHIVLPSVQSRGLSAEQLAKRTELEAAVESLRVRKASLAEDAYYDALERLFVELAELNAGSSG